MTRTSGYRPFDVGAHLHPESVLPDAFAGASDLVGAHHHDVERLDAWYEAAGYGGAALSQPFYLGGGDLEAVREANDALLDAIEGYDRFFGLAAVPTAAGGEAAAEEFERCLEAGYNGGALETESDGIELDDPEVRPVLEVADRTGAPLLVHPKLNESLHPDVLEEYRLNAIFGREAALSESVFKVIHGGVLDRFSGLNLVYHHLGGNLASMLGRVHLQLDEGRWPGEEVKPYDEFKAQLEDRIYLDTSGFFGYRRPLRAALEELPSTQLLFGTDAPYEPRDEGELRAFVAAVEDVASRRDADRVLGGNAFDLMVNV